MRTRSCNRRRASRFSGETQKPGLRDFAGAIGRSQKLHGRRKVDRIAHGQANENQSSKNEGTDGAGENECARPVYLNSDEFTRLFVFRRKHHADICLGLRLIVARVSRRFRFAMTEDRREAESETLLYLIQRIDRFRPSKGKNAFSYYTSVAWNRILFHLKSCNAPCGRRVGKGVYERTFSELAAA